MLIVSALLLITLDLRGVSVVSGARNAVGTALSPVAKIGNAVVSPFKNFFSDLFRLGSTRETITKLKEENARLKTELLEQKNVEGQVKQLKESLQLAGRAQWKVVSAKAIAQGSAISFTNTITIDQGTRAGVRPNMTVVNQGVLELLDNTTQLRARDVLLARGSNNNRPFVPGVPIGFITKVPDSSNYVAQVADVTFYANLNAVGVVSVVLSAPESDPRNALVPKAPTPTPIPTVTVFVTPTPSAGAGNTNNSNTKGDGA